MSKLDNYLSELEEQELQVEKNIQVRVVKNPVLDSICKKYSPWSAVVSDPMCIRAVQGYYDSALDLLEGKSYSAKDIRDFSFFLVDYEKAGWYIYDAGLFLSALINSSEEENFEIMTVQLSKVIRFVGFETTKNIVIQGSVDQVGKSMKKGKILVKGNAGPFIGEGMHGGEIIVEGNSEQYTGNCMTGGKIIVQGNTGTHTGNWSTGGEIHVEGRIERTGDCCKAKIYQRGVELKC